MTRCNAESVTRLGALSDGTGTSAPLGRAHLRCTRLRSSDRAPL